MERFLQAILRKDSHERTPMSKRGGQTQSKRHQQAASRAVAALDVLADFFPDWDDEETYKQRCTFMVLDSQVQPFLESIATLEAVDSEVWRQDASLSERGANVILSAARWWCRLQLPPSAETRISRAQAALFGPALCTTAVRIAVVEIASAHPSLCDGILPRVATLIVHVVDGHGRDAMAELRRLIWAVSDRRTVVADLRLQLFRELALNRFLATIASMGIGDRAPESEAEFDLLFDAVPVVAMTVTNYFEIRTFEVLEEAEARRLFRLLCRALQMRTGPRAMGNEVLPILSMIWNLVTEQRDGTISTTWHVWLCDAFFSEPNALNQMVSVLLTAIDAIEEGIRRYSPENNHMFRLPLCALLLGAATTSDLQVRDALFAAMLTARSVKRSTLAAVLLNSFPGEMVGTYMHGMAKLRKTLLQLAPPLHPDSPAPGALSEFLAHPRWRRTTCGNGACSQEWTSALRTCSGCQTVSYCSSSCQKTDWPQHKHSCKAAKSVTLAKNGTH